MNENVVDSVTHSVEDSVTTLEVITQKGIELTMEYGPKLILAFVVLFFGFWIIRMIIKALDATMTRAGVESTLKKFLKSLLSVVLKILLLVIFASMIGVETASLIAMLGAAGLAVGLALQGSLANFAGGVLVLFFKPYRVGDVIDSQGYIGKVLEIQMFNTILLTYDNQKVVIPNALLSNGCVTNMFSEPTRRVDITFGISYQDDCVAVKEILSEIQQQDERILDTPPAKVHISGHGDSAIDVLTRSWVKSEDYWDVYFDLYEKVKVVFDQRGISIPFPQRDVHLHHSPAQTAQVALVKGSPEAVSK